MSDPIDPQMQLVDDAIRVLGEHFETVQIFTSNYAGDEDGTTKTIAKGVGNWYARYGHVRSWIERQDEGTRIDIRKDE